MSSDDLRLGYLLSAEHLRACKAENFLSLIGFACDQGVLLNGGQDGGRDAPSEFRSRFGRMGSVINPELDIDLRKRIKIQDLGDIECADGDLKAAHADLKAKVLKALEETSIPVCIGGGDDLCFPCASALMDFLGSGIVGVVNVDAHLDAEPLKETPDGSQLPHAGSAIRQLLTDKAFKANGGQLVQFAAQGEQCSSAHAKFVLANGGQILWLSALRGWGDVVEEFCKVLDSFGESQPVFVVFDLDAVRGSDAPGVTCPATVGLSSEESLEMCQEAGKRPNVCMLGISNFNPHVESERTARLMVNMVYQFALGIAQRK